jgi:hypothetical protein
LHERWALGADRPDGPEGATRHPAPAGSLARTFSHGRGLRAAVAEPDCDLTKLLLMGLEWRLAPSHDGGSVVKARWPPPSGVKLRQRRAVLRCQMHIRQLTSPAEARLAEECHERTRSAGSACIAHRQRTWNMQAFSIIRAGNGRQRGVHHLRLSAAARSRRRSPPPSSSGCGTDSRLAAQRDWARHP